MLEVDGAAGVTWLSDAKPPWLPLVALPLNALKS